MVPGRPVDRGDGEPAGAGGEEVAGVGDRAGPGRAGVGPHALGGLLQQRGDLLGEPLHGLPRVAAAHGGREQHVDQHPDRRTDERLDDPAHRGRLGTGGEPDAEHQHRADRHLDQVRAQPQQLADDDRGGDQDAEAPPGEADDRGEADRQRHAGDDGEDALDAAEQGARRRGLHDQQRGQRGDQRGRVDQADPSAAR